MKDDFRREKIIDYICILSDERVNPIPLFNKKEYSFIDLRRMAFRWFCHKHKIDLLEIWYYEFKDIENILNNKLFVLQ